ncbi:MAG: hypothetical protein PHQ75_15160, partial [Thermoguttaceae bacterium]|nr:hypothetical protein [Thermoguttaceae bacterium]
IGPEAAKVFDSLLLGLDEDEVMECEKYNPGSDKATALGREIRKRYPTTSLQRKFLFDALNDREIGIDENGYKEEVRVEALRTMIQLRLSEEERKQLEQLLDDKKKNIRTAARIVLAITQKEN